MNSFATLSQITPSNVSTYIQSASIQTAQIASLAVGSAKIQDLAVSTIKIANQAVTIPVSLNQEGSITWATGALQTIATLTISNDSSVYMPVTGIVTCNIYWQSGIVRNTYPCYYYIQDNGGNTLKVFPSSNDVVSFQFVATILPNSSTTFYFQWVGNANPVNQIKNTVMTILGTKR